jgi:hypothetical protein
MKMYASDLSEHRTDRQAVVSAYFFNCGPFCNRVDLSKYRKTRRSFQSERTRGPVYVIIPSSGLDECYVFSLVSTKLAARINYKGTMAGATARKMLLSNIPLCNCLSIEMALAGGCGGSIAVRWSACVLING